MCVCVCFPDRCLCVSQITFSNPERGPYQGRRCGYAPDGRFTDRAVLWRVSLLPTSVSHTHTHSHACTQNTLWMSDSRTSVLIGDMNYRLYPVIMIFFTPCLFWLGTPQRIVAHCHVYLTGLIWEQNDYLCEWKRSLCEAGFISGSRFAHFGSWQIKLPFYGDDFLGIAELPLAC